MVKIIFRDYFTGGFKNKTSGVVLGQRNVERWQL